MFELKTSCSFEPQIRVPFSDYVRSTMQQDAEGRWFYTRRRMSRKATDETPVRQALQTIVHIAAQRSLTLTALLKAPCTTMNCQETKPIRLGSASSKPYTAPPLILAASEIPGRARIVPLSFPKSTDSAAGGGLRTKCRHTGTLRDGSAGLPERLAWSIFAAPINSGCNGATGTIRAEHRLPDRIAGAAPRHRFDAGVAPFFCAVQLEPTGHLRAPDLDATRLRSATCFNTLAIPGPRRFASAFRAVVPSLASSTRTCRANDLAYPFRSNRSSFGRRMGLSAKSMLDFLSSFTTPLSLWSVPAPVLQARKSGCAIPSCQRAL